MKPSYLKTSLYTIVTATLLLASSQNYAQQYYKWVDANGSTHYTTTPPPKGAKRLDKVATYGSHQPAKADSVSHAPTELPTDAVQHTTQATAEAPTDTVKPPSPSPTTPSSER